MDDLTVVYSDGKVDVYADQKVLDWYIQYPAPYSGEFSGPLYFTFRDEATRQSIIKRIRDNRPKSSQADMSCTVPDPVHGGPIHRSPDCSNEGPYRNLDFLKYIAVNVTFTTTGPGNILLPPGTTIPPRLFIIGPRLYLSSPRCAGLDTYHDAVDKSIPPGGEYINALDQLNSSLIEGSYIGSGGHDEFMLLFVDSSSKIATTVLPGYYEVGEADTSLISRSVSGAAAKIVEGRRQRNRGNQTP